MNTGKIFVLFTAILGVSPFLIAQSNSPSSSGMALPQPTAYSVVKRSANANVWERYTYEKAPDGTIVPKKHQYTELGTGLNFQDPQTGQWTPSKEEVDILPDGTASATQGQHQAYFPGDIYDGFIEMVTPDGKHLKSRPVGLSYDDGNNTVLIAVLTNSAGELSPPNKVYYPDAFDGVSASVRYTYTKAGFEQDIILKEQLPSPESFGLDPATTRLQVLTEFYDTNSPVQTTSLLNTQNRIADTTLTFGKIKMIRGKAFSINGANQSGSKIGETPTYKSWLNINGRKFLVEELPFPKIVPQLARLPKMASMTANRPIIASADSILNKVCVQRLLPPQHLDQTTTDKAIQLAKANLPSKREVVLDYVTVDSDTNDFTFQGDTTYFVSGYFYLYGTNTVEGGAVIKFDNDSDCNSDTGLTIQGPLICKTGSYHPAILTSKDDNTVGETISGSSGNPQIASCNYYMTLYSSSPASINYLRFNYANEGLELSGGEIDIWNCQFENCAVGLDNWDNNPCHLHNCLFANTQIGFDQDGSEVPLTADQVTFADVSSYTDYYPMMVYLTNCLFMDSGINGIVSTNHVAFGSVSTTFQTVGAGSYYLTNNSPYRNAGTTNIDPRLLIELAQRTTYPPIVYSNIVLTTPTTFSPQAQRDTNASPDLGYHYDPIDYFFGGVKVNSNLTFTAGTAVGWFELPGSGGPGYGIGLKNGVTAAFNGTVVMPCNFARYDAVQEGGNGLWKDKGWLAGVANIDSYNPSAPPVLMAHFTHFNKLAGDPNHFRDGSAGQPLIIHGTDCEILNSSGGYNLLMAFTNCLFDRASDGQSTSETYPYEIYENCTFHGGALQFSGPWYASIRNCAFDGTTFSAISGDYDYNAFLTNAPQLPSEGVHTIIVTNFNWQSSWFGDFYLSTNSPLIDAGDRTADTIGLYHFTTQTNQTIEGTSTNDIGYHYVATDANGNPLDSNGDGIPDYVEDANGNGIYDSGDLNYWDNIDGDSDGLPDWWETDYFGHLGVDPNADPDADGWTNLQEYQNGTNPNVVDAPFNLLITEPVNNSPIP